MTRKMNVLIAEDDETDRLIVSRAFTDTTNNVSPTFACDGQEAIEHLQSAAGIKLLLLDLKMPRMDGFQVLEWLVNHPANRPERVVVLSSSVDPRDKQRTRQLGADLHLTKPHDSREYVRIVRSQLDDAPAACAPTGTSSPFSAAAPSPRR